MAAGDTRPLVNRRRVLQSLGASGLTAVAGCQAPDSELGDTLVDPDGEDVTLTLVYSTGSQFIETTVEYIQQEYDAVGITLELEGLPFDAMLARYAQNFIDNPDEATFNAGPRDEATSREPWDLMYGIRFNTYPRTPTSIRPFWVDERRTDEATVNFYGYRPSEDLGALLDEASRTVDDDARQELLATVFGLLSEDQPVNFVLLNVGITGFQESVRGLNVGPSLGYDSVKWYFDGPDAPAVTGTYTSGAATDAETLNPIRIADAPSGNRVGLTMDGAYSFDNDVEFVPRTVESITSDDKRVWEVTLRENLRWSEPYGAVTAEDWVYYIQEVHQADENWAGDVNRSDWFRDGEPIPVEQTGRYRFEIRLPEVDPAFPKKPIMWGAWTMPKGLIEPYREAGDGEGLNRDEAVQTLSYTGNLGPYTFERWDRDSIFVATRNEEYYLREDPAYEGTPFFERSGYRVFGEESTRLAALETGEITASSVPPNRVAQFEDDPSINVVQTPQPFIRILIYNQRANGWTPFRDRSVRRALAYVVGKRSIVDNINRGYANVAHTFQPEYSEWFDDSKVWKTGVDDTYDPDRAKALLAEALPDGYGFE